MNTTEVRAGCFTFMAHAVVWLLVICVFSSGDLSVVCDCGISWPYSPGPEVITYYILNSAEHKIPPAHKNLNIDKRTTSYFKTLRCCIYNANKC